MTNLPIVSYQATRLDPTSAPVLIGGAQVHTALGKMVIRFKTSTTNAKSTSSLKWSVDIKEAGAYNFAVYMCYFSAVASTTAKVKTAGGTVSKSIAFRKNNPGHSGWYNDPSDFSDWQNHDEYFSNYATEEITQGVVLKAGLQDIELEFTLGRKEVVEFRALRMTPQAAAASIAQEEKDAKAARASTQWMVDAKYGVFFHWTGLTAQRKYANGKNPISYKQAVINFDVRLSLVMSLSM